MAKRTIMPMPQEECDKFTANLARFRDICPKPGAPSERVDWKTPMSQDERDLLIADLARFHESYLQVVDRSNRYIRKEYYFHLRIKSVHAVEWNNNCYISNAARKRIGSFKNYAEFYVRKKGKGLIVEHINPVKSLRDIFFQDSFDAEQWFDLCKIAYITKDEDDKLRNKENEIRAQNESEGRGCVTEIEIHHQAYRETGLFDTLTLAF